MSVALLPWLVEPLARGLSLRAHALLLHGPAGVGQFELGLALASGWLCEAPSDAPRPCGRCASCSLMAAHSHPDFLVLLPDALRARLGWGAVDEGDDNAKSTKAKPSKEIRIEAVRSAIDWGHRTTSRGRTKVLLIHPSQAMNLIAANALLKTLEEPAGRLRLIMTADDPEALLPTVRSRCQRLRLVLPPGGQALDWLTERGVVRAAVMLAAAGGQPFEALALAGEGIDSDTWERLPGAIKHGQAAVVSDWPLARLVDAMQKLCHDLMCLAAGAAPRYFSPAVLKPLMLPRSGQAAPEWSALARWSADLVLAARHEEHPWHSALRVEALVGQGARLWQTPRSPATTAGDRLDTLSA